MTQKRKKSLVNICPINKWKQTGNVSSTSSIRMTQRVQTVYVTCSPITLLVRRWNFFTTRIDYPTLEKTPSEMVIKRPKNIMFCQRHCSPYKGGNRPIWKKCSTFQMSKSPLIPLKALPKANNVTIVSENENSNDNSFKRPNSQIEVRKPSSTKKSSQWQWEHC